MKNLYLLLIAICSLQGIAQNKSIPKKTCGTEAPLAAWDLWFNQRVEEFKRSDAYSRSTATDYKIPVVFHVIHGGQNQGTYPNLSQAQINSQISILNNDFAGTGLNVGNFASTNFSQGLVSNCNVSFCLAEKDPSGNLLTQPGINRVNYTANSWANPTSFTTFATFKNYIETVIKPNTIWNPTRYLNIWISDVDNAVGLLGYATFPSNSTLSGLTSNFGTATTDGVWCLSSTIGDVGTLLSPYDKGRTTTHEIGHWLGLRHIWGDSNCGTDYCNDTPTQDQANVGCPTFPHVTCSNGPNGDMFMNFMDYCNDACLYMFTPDQRTRIQTAMANCPFRTQLTASSATLCGAAPWVSCADTISNFTSVDSLYSYRRATAGPSDPGCIQGIGNAGYITGTNCYGDKEKAEFIPHSKYSSISSPVITGVLVLFFQYGNMGTDGTANVNMNIYSGSSAANAPGALLGSTTDNLANIAATNNVNQVSYCGNPNLAFAVPLIMPYKFTFSSPIPAPTSGGFFASVSIPNTPGDTISILDESTGIINTAWEKYSDDSWHDMFNSWGSARKFNLAILPIIDCTTGLNEKTFFQEQVSLFPNPTNGKINIFTSFKGEEHLQVNVFNVFGQKVYEKPIVTNDQTVIELDLSNELQGVYFVELIKGSEKITKKVVLQK